MDRVWQRLLERHRTRYWPLALASFGVGIIAVMVVPTLIALGLVMDLDAGGVRVLLGVGIGVLVLTNVTTQLVTWPSIGRPLRRWLAGEDRDPDRAWAAAGRATVRPAVVSTTVYAGLTLVALLVLRDQGLLPVSTRALVALMLVATPAVLGVIGLGGRQLIEPVLRELAREHQRPPVGRVLRLSPAMVVGAVSLTFFGASAGLAVAASTVGPDERLLVGSAVIVATMLWAGTLYWWLVAAPLLTPLADLTARARRIAAGDLEGDVTVVASDEIGRLGSAFNEMLHGLRERQRLHDAFSAYVDPQLTARLLEQPDARFAGELAQVTVLFLDVRDFTSYAHDRDPAEVVGRLNDVFGVVVPVLSRHGGHVNKYLGDGVLAVFGAPIARHDHADRGVRAAAEIADALASRFGDTLRYGLGVNSGSAVAGTVGGGDKLEFTLIGDVVNVAARVESLTKELGDPVLITEATLAALTAPDTAPATTPRGPHQVRGRVEPVWVHTLA